MLDTPFSAVGLFGTLNIGDLITRSWVFTGTLTVVDFGLLTSKNKIYIFNYNELSFEIKNNIYIYLKIA